MKKDFTFLKNVYFWITLIVFIGLLIPISDLISEDVFESISKNGFWIDNIEASNIILPDNNGEYTEDVCYDFLIKEDIANAKSLCQYYECGNNVDSYINDVMNGCELLYSYALEYNNKCSNYYLYNIEYQQVQAIYTTFIKVKYIDDIKNTFNSKFYLILFRNMISG